jgi:hypothetical protein
VNSAKRQGLRVRESFVTCGVESSAATVGVGQAVAAIGARKTFPVGSPAIGVIATRER